MYHGRLRVNVGGKELQLRFNNYSNLEAEKIFGKEDDLFKGIQERAAQNEFAFIADLIWIGVVGHREVSLTETQMTRLEIRENIAECDMKEIAEVSGAFFDHIGRNLEVEKVEPSGEKKS